RVLELGASEAAPRLRRVINATGVVLHTNLGRAPLHPDAVQRVAEIASGYSNLELDLSTGRRGHRSAHVEPLLCELFGAEAAHVVNNCAGATMLAGPQAGIVLGGAALVEPCRKHPLSRALRADRMRLAALEATLRLYRDGRARELPALQALHAPPEELRQRATRLALSLQ